MKEAETKAKEIDNTIAEGGYDIKRQEISDNLSEKPTGVRNASYYANLQRQQLSMSVADREDWRRNFLNSIETV